MGKYDYLIPEDHICTKCNKTKFEVNFSARTHIGVKKKSVYIRPICNACRNHHDKSNKTLIATCLDGFKQEKKKRILTISQKIKEYFNEQSRSVAVHG